MYKITKAPEQTPKPLPSPHFLSWVPPFHHSYPSPHKMSILPQTQGETIPDAWDYQGRPAERSKTGGWAAAAMILGLYYYLSYALSDDRAKFTLRAHENILLFDYLIYTRLLTWR